MVPIQLPRGVAGFSHNATAATSAARGLVFDLVLFADHLPEATELACRVPEATFVLDHLGKPTIAAHVPPDWRRDLAAIAKLPNVTAKVSGLITESATGRR